MKTNYSKIDAALSRLVEAGADLREMSSLTGNLISGAPDISDEIAEVESAQSELIDLVNSVMANGCRLTTLMEHLDGEFTTSRMVDDEISERQFYSETGFTAQDLCL